MISFIIGEVDSIEKNTVILNNNGIGYEIKVADETKIITSDKKLKLYTFMSVKEDSINLYGFCSLAELQTFKKLITVSGIGPKAAMNILANMTQENIYFAIATENIDSLSKIPGVGKKTAQRLILELKDKITLPDNLPKSDELSDAVEALCSLGYERAQIIKIAVQMQTDGLDAQQIIKQILKLLAK